MIYLLWGVLMTTLTFVLGGLPLKSLRKGAGRIVYWVACLAAAGALAAGHMYLLSAMFLSQVILIGVFSEFEELGLGLISSSFFAVLMTAMLSAGGFAFWVYSVGPGWLEAITALGHQVLDPVLQINTSLNLDVKELVMQLPSVATILWIVTLYLSVLLEPRLTAPSKEPLPASRFREELALVRAPDFMVWLFIGSLLGTFGSFGEAKIPALHGVAVNLFNICLVVFFFQGLGVVGKFFERIKLGWLWQTLLMVFIILQLFIFVSLIGLLDHWMDFRTRLNKGREELNRET